jgi:phosphoribosyl 1,2-cyclic phosphodiesterase
LFILDAGTGIRKLGLSLDKHLTPIDGTLLISHAHWDHIHGLPFFAPALESGNRFRVYGCAGTAAHLKSVLTGQMETPYFPVPLDSMTNCLEFREFGEQPLVQGPACVRSLPLHHPGQATGFRIEVDGRSLVYATDQEPHPAPNGGEPVLDPLLLRFAAGADLLICDAQYTPEEYRRRVGWGHSSVTDAVRLGIAADVRRLALFHHDPERSDADLDRIHIAACQEIARRGGQLNCVIAAEGMELRL